MTRKTGPGDEGAPEAPSQESLTSTVIRAGAIAIAEDRVALIARTHVDGRTFYEIPGGGVEDGESLEAAVLRELWEETGLSGTLDRPLATVLRNGQHQHYFLVRVSETALSMNQGPEHTQPGYMPERFEPTWMPIRTLSTIPVWPTSLARCVAAWWASGWPSDPVYLEDDETALFGENP